MNFQDMVKDVEAGTQKAYRFWRYVFPPRNMMNDIFRPLDLVTKWPVEPVLDPPVILLSAASDLRWYPRQFVEGTSPDVGEQGIHGFKTMDDLLWAFCDEPHQLVARSQASGCDGVVLGTVELWGIIHDHTKGYRAQFARPLSFVSSYGNRSEQALAELRAGFFGRKP